MNLEDDREVNVYVKKYLGGRGRLVRGLEKFRWGRDKVTGKPTQEERRIANVVWPEEYGKFRVMGGTPVDGIPESSEHNPARLAYIGDMVLKRENVVFGLRLKTLGTVKVMGFDMSTADEHVFVRSETYYQKLEEFRTNEAADIGDRMTATELWNSVLRDSFDTDKRFLEYCNTCLRMFYSPMAKQNRLAICQDCLERYVTDRCNDREDRVMREVTGHVVGLSTDEEMRAFSEDVARM